MQEMRQQKLEMAKRTQTYVQDLPTIEDDQPMEILPVDQDHLKHVVSTLEGSLDPSNLN